VAQIGAVIGRDFSYSLLQRAVAGMDDPLQVARLTKVMTRYDSLLSATLPAPPTEARYERRCGSLHQACDRVFIDHAAPQCRWHAGRHGAAACATKTEKDI
jgi:hypothetical protein